MSSEPTFMLMEANEDDLFLAILGLVQPLGFHQLPAYAKAFKNYWLSCNRSAA